MPSLRDALTALRKAHGSVRTPTFRTPFEIVLFENVAYLVPDARRESVWAAFCAEIGTDPEDIATADPDHLERVLRPGGMHPSRRTAKIRECCAIVLEEFDGDFEAILSLPPGDRRKALKRFPGFGDPGVDKILMLAKEEKVLALESNGMRVLLRVGFGEPAKNYATSYRSVQGAIADQLPSRADAIARAHFVLRAHGKAICKQNEPRCSECCLAETCPSSRA